MSEERPVVSPFQEECYELLKRIPRGKVTTYKLLGEAIQSGRKGGSKARAVGNACNRNPYAPKVPCHRVIRSNGELGGYAFGTHKKAAILKREGVHVSKDYKIDLSEFLYSF